MIEVTLTETEYNEFVFDDVSQQTVEAERAPIALNLLIALSDEHATAAKPLSDAERRRARAVGRKLWPGRRQIVPEHAYGLERRELALLIRLLERATARHPILVLPDFLGLVKRLRGVLAEAQEAGRE